MPTKLAIICNVERLSSHDDATSVCFGLNVIPALTETSAFPQELLQPWVWSISKIVASVSDASGPISPAYDTEVIPQLDSQATILPIRKRLEDEYLLRKSPEYFKWDAGNPKNGDSTSSDPNTDPRENLKWHQVLAHASTYPAPIGGLLNLSLIVKIKNLKAADLATKKSVFLAPQFSVDLTTQSGSTKFSFDLTTSPMTGTNEWTYTIPAGLPANYVDAVTAYQMPFIPAKNSVAGPLDLNTLWFGIGNGYSNNEGTNWLSKLEHSLGAAMDLPQLLSQAYNDILTEKERGDLQVAILASLRDLTCTGYLPGPGGMSFLALLLSHLNQKLSSSEIKTLEQTLAAADQTVTTESWLQSIIASIALSGSASTPASADRLLGKEPFPKDEWLRQVSDLIATVSDEQVKKRILFDRWNAVLTGNASWEIVKQNLKDDILRYDSTDLPIVSLKAGMANGLLGCFWSLVTKPGTTVQGSGKTELRTGISEAISSYYLGRFELGSIEQKQRCAPLFPKFKIENASNEVLSKIKAAADKVAKRIIPEDSAPKLPTKVPEGITVQLASIHDGTDDTLTRSLSGVGILMRRSNQDWYGLNVAQVKAGKDVFSACSSVPLRLNFQNDLCSSLFTYDGHPLVAKSHAAELQNNFQVYEREEVGVPAEFGFEYDLVQGSNWGKIPALIFGQDYEFAAYGITNSGVLPRVLTDSHPTRLKPNPPQKGDLPDSLVPKRKIRYLRTTSIGQPRFRSFVETNASGNENTRKIKQVDDKKLTDFSEEVVPLAHDLGYTQNPLILLWRAENSYRFAVSAPSTDLNSWDRWVAADPAMRDTRVCVWADVHRSMNDETGVGAVPDVLIQDACVDSLRFAMKRLYPEAKEVFVADFDCKGSKVKKPQDGSDYKNGAGLRAITGPSANVTLTLLDEEFASPPARPFKQRTNNSEPIDITTKRGEIWELTISSVVLAASKERFENFDSGYSPFSPIEGGAKFLASPLKFTIEGAVDSMPTAEDVYQSLLVSQTVPSGDGCRLIIDPTKAANPNVFTYIKGVELLRQCWRWNGNSMNEYPFGKLPLDPSPASRNSTEAMNWEATAFHSRTENDSSRTYKEVYLGPFIDDKKKMVPGKSAQIHEENMSHDLRASYFRYSIIVTSRYKGLRNFHVRHVQSLLALETPVPDKSPQKFTTWKRFYIPCRWTDQVPKPAIKFVLPLTHGEDSAVRAAGFVVVVSEEWYQVGGLSERLHMEVCMTENTRKKYPTPVEPKPKDMRYEAGEDPIMYGRSISVNDVVTKQGEPLGCTFDTDTDAPLFVNTAVYFDPPELAWTQPAQVEPAWNFLKVQFKRTLAKEGHADGSRDRVSELSPPIWIQLLQQSSLYLNENNNSWHRIKDLTLEVDKLGTNIAGNFSNGGVVKLQPTKSDDNIFSLWIMVTRKITDMLGNKEHESFVSVLPYSSNKGLTGPDFDKTFMPGFDYLARVIEVQQVRGFSSTESFFDFLFVPERMSDVGARIVRVSEPTQVTLS